MTGLREGFDDEMGESRNVTGRTVYSSCVRIKGHVLGPDSMSTQCFL